MLGYPGNSLKSPTFVSIWTPKRGTPGKSTSLGGPGKAAQGKITTSKSHFASQSLFYFNGNPKSFLSTSASFNCFSSRWSELRGCWGVLSSLLIFLCSINKTHVDAHVPPAPPKCTHTPSISLRGRGPSEKGRLQDGSAPDQWIFETQTHGPGPTPHVLITTHVPIKESGETQGAQRTEHSEDIPGD